MVIYDDSDSSKEELETVLDSKCQKFDHIVINANTMITIT